MIVRSPDDISATYSGFTEFSKTRASVTYPPKMDVPFVWDLYMDTEPPLGVERMGDAAGALAGTTSPQIVAAPVTGTDSGGAPHGAPAARDIELLSLMNDRMKQQSRRYPHPIINEMEEYL